MYEDAQPGPIVGNLHNLRMIIRPLPWHFHSTAFSPPPNVHHPGTQQLPYFATNNLHVTKVHERGVDCCSEDHIYYPSITYSRQIHH